MFLCYSLYHNNVNYNPNLAQLLKNSPKSLRAKKKCQKSTKPQWWKKSEWMSTTEIMSVYNVRGMQTRIPNPNEKANRKLT